MGISRFLLLTFLLIPISATGDQVPQDLQWLTNNTDSVWSSSNALKGGSYTTFIMSAPKTLRTMGPHSNHSFRHYIADNQLSLVGYHPNTSKAIPQLATHWAFSKDRKTIFFKLDPNAVWSDGEKVISKDYLFSLNLMKSKFIKDSWHNRYANKIHSITIYNDHTISISSNKKQSFSDLLYSLNISPSPKHYYADLTRDWNTTYNWAITPNTGPYEITSIATDSEIIFKRKTDWWGENKRYNVGRFNVDEVILKIIEDPNLAYKEFELGNLDSFLIPHDQFWKTQAIGRLYDNGYLEKLTFLRGATSHSNGIFLNTSHPILKNNKIRAAISHAIDFDKILKNSVSDSHIRSPLFFIRSQLHSEKGIQRATFDSERSNALLDDSGWTKRNKKGVRMNKGKPLSLELIYSDKENLTHWQLIKRYLLSIGIELILKSLPQNMHYQATMNKEYALTAFGWRIDSPINYWEHFHSENALNLNTNNIAGLNNSDIDRIIERHENESNLKAKLTIEFQLAQAINKANIFIPGLSTTISRGAHWRWLRFPVPASSNASNNIYKPFGIGGVFWINPKVNIDTKAARLSSSKYPITNKTFKPTPNIINN